MRFCIAGTRTFCRGSVIYKISKELQGQKLFTPAVQKDLDYYKLTNSQILP